MCADSRRRRNDIGLIPTKWKTEVIRILKGDPRYIHETQESIDHWDLYFPNEFPEQRFDAFAAALRSDHLVGKRIYDMTPQGETYAFFFSHQNTKLYGKLSLLDNDQLVFVYSNHPPERDYL